MIGFFEGCSNYGSPLLGNISLSVLRSQSDCAEAVLDSVSAKVQCAGWCTCRAQHEWQIVLWIFVDNTWQLCSSYTPYMHLFFNVLFIIFFTWKVRFCKTWGLIQWIFLKLFEKILMLHTESSSTCDKVFHIRSLLFARSFPHLGQNLKETCKDSTRWTKHGFEGRRRSCVTVSFSLPTLGFLGRMCSEDFEISCEDFEMCLKISKCVVKISKYVVKISICVVKISKYVAKISKCDVRSLRNMLWRFRNVFWRFRNKLQRLWNVLWRFQNL